MSPVLDAKALDARRFGKAELDALWHAILEDDEVDAETPVPDAVELDFDQETLIDCYRLSRQLWVEGVDREEMVALTVKLRRDRDLDEADRLAFKYARARIKNVRFACALFGARHAYPTLLDWMTTALGHVQDAFKTGHKAAVWREALLCRLFMARPTYALIRREIATLKGASTADAVRVLYGGSVSPANVAELVGQTDVDGGLVGGASLQADSFMAMVRAIA